MLGAGKNTVEIIIAAKDRTKAAFAKVNTQMKTMKGGAGRLGGAMNTLKGGLSNVTSSLGSFGAALGPLGIAVAGAAVVMATLGGAAIKASLEFEKAVATIRVGTGATGEALAGLEGSFKTVFTAVPTTTAAAATAIADLNTRLGLTGEPLEALATQFLNLSRITGTDVAASISSATRVMHDFAVTSEDQAGALDNLFKVSQSTGIGMTNLANNMTRYGGVMRQMGFDINTSAALLGKFEKEGVNLELVLSSLRMGLANFARAGEEPVEALQRVITEIEGMGSSADRNLKAIEVFGARSGPDMAAAIYEGRFAIGELMATLDASGETINKAAEDTLTFGDKWTLLKNNIMEAIAPIGDVITNVLGNAIEGLSASFNMLQAVIGPVMSIFKSFYDAINSAISSAFAPLTERIAELQQKFKEGSERLTIFSDIITIVAAGAKWLGEKIGILVKMALTPLVNKLKEGIDMLIAFYNKLGPIKDLIEFMGGGVHNLAESFRDQTSEMHAAMLEINAMTAAIEDYKDKAIEAPKAIIKEWKKAVEAFEDGSGTYKDAIQAIDTEIETLMDLWENASKEEKELIDEWVRDLAKLKAGMVENKQVSIDHFKVIIDQTEKAIEKTKEFIVTIGDTTIEFKGAAAEVVKNADAYEKLQKSAQTLIDLDWAVFTEFEASLPRIDAGIGDMESSFVGLKGVLEDNIEELENIKQSVIDVSEIAAPFLEKGFLEGIKAIGKFAGALKDAGSAIGDFSSLQDVSIEGCINFSMHVRDMVSALQILENQMEDLVPAFGNMDSLIQDIVGHFIWTGGRKETFGDELNRVATAQREARQELNAGVITWGEYMARLEETGHVMDVLKRMSSASFGTLYDVQQRYIEGTEDINEVTKDFLGTSGVAEKQMNRQTDALKHQTEQLNKITEALQPYLEFMRTLNELAALSTLSITDLNNGLNSINDTLNNLGVVLSSFDIKPVMESLFGTKITEGDLVGDFTGGAAKGFMDTMSTYQSQFAILEDRILRFTSAILNLVNAFEALTNISESVLADQTKLKEVFEGITEVTSNFSAEMGGTEGFAQKFADGMDAMLESAEPLMKYFQDNKEAIMQFNSSLRDFGATITNIINVFEDLASAVKRSSELVIVSTKDMEAALALIPAQLGEIAVFLGTDIWGDIVKGLSAVDFSWETYAKTVDDSMPAFTSAMDTFSTLISKILSLSTALKDMRDMTVLSVRDIDEALKNIPVFLDRFVDALALNMGAIKQSLKDLDKEWALHTEEMKAVMPSYEDSTSAIGELVGSLLSLGSALKSLAETGIITEREFDVGFKSLMTSISNFAVSLSNNVDDLVVSLQKLRTVWVENEAVLFPLIRDFAIISDNLWGVAHNANRMAKEFAEIRKNSKTLEKGFESLIKFINQVVESTKEFYTTEAAAELAGYIEDVGKVINAFVNLERELKDAMGKVEKAIDNAVTNMHKEVSTLGDLPKSAYTWGENTMQSYINGIKSKTEALAAAVSAQAGVVEDHLGTYSNAKVGPLSHLDEWPRNLVQSYSSGIEAEMHTLNSSFAALVPGMGAGSAGGGNKNVNLYVTQNISDRDTADYANRGLERVLQRHAVM